MESRFVTCNRELLVKRCNILFLNISKMDFTACSPRNTGSSQFLLPFERELNVCFLLTKQLFCIEMLVYVGI